VKSDADERRFFNEAEKMAGSLKISGTLDVVGWPLCEVRKFAADISGRQGFDTGIHIEPNHADSHYAIGEQLRAKLKSSGEIGSGWYAFDIVDPQGVVAHLLPVPGEQLKYSNAQPITLEPHKGYAKWPLSPPPGKWLLLLIESNQPLPDPGDDEDLDIYIARLKASFARTGQLARLNVSSLDVSQ
jgi:hypothetical protein